MIFVLEYIRVKFVGLTLSCNIRLKIALTCRVKKRRILFGKIGNFNAGQYVVVQ
jgi:hypothetical protein